jgi:hypothetical protein
MDHKASAAAHYHLLARLVLYLYLPDKQIADICYPSSSLPFDSVLAARYQTVMRSRHLSLCRHAVDHLNREIIAIPCPHAPDQNDLDLASEPNSADKHRRARTQGNKRGKGLRHGRRLNAQNRVQSRSTLRGTNKSRAELLRLIINGRSYRRLGYATARCCHCCCCRL